jgi:hypothetical protein
MGVNLKNIDLGEVQPQCNECGVCLCWSIDDTEYYQWKNFWDNWKCRDCNKNYKGAYEKFKSVHQPYEWLTKLIENNESNRI